MYGLASITFRSLLTSLASDIFLRYISSQRLRLPAMPHRGCELRKIAGLFLLTLESSCLIQLRTGILFRDRNSATRSSSLSLVE